MKFKQNHKNLNKKLVAHAFLVAAIVTYGCDFSNIWNSVTTSNSENNHAAVSIIVTVEDSLNLRKSSVATNFLQPSTFENSQNNFTQQAFNLNPNLASGQVKLVLDKAIKQETLAVQKNTNTKKIVVRNAQRLGAFHFNPSPEKTKVFGYVQNLSSDNTKKEFVQKLVVADSITTKISNTEQTRNFNNFEVLRC